MPVNSVELVCHLGQGQQATTDRLALVTLAVHSIIVVIQTPGLGNPQTNDVAIHGNIAAKLQHFTGYVIDEVPSAVSVDPGSAM